jgi:hypothetical protein
MRNLFYTPVFPFLKPARVDVRVDNRVSGSEPESSSVVADTEDITTAELPSEECNFTSCN